MSTRFQGPNVKKLIVRRMTVLAIPNDGNFEDGLAFLMDPDRMAKVAKEATDWVFKMLDYVKKAPDYDGETDEEIAAAVLEKTVTIKIEKG